MVDPRGIFYRFSEEGRGRKRKGERLRKKEVYAGTVAVVVDPRGISIRFSEEQERGGGEEGREKKRCGPEMLPWRFV